MIKVNFQWLADTKGAVRFQEVGDDGRPKKSDADGAVIGSLYLRKAALKELGISNLKGFTVTVTAI